MCIICIKPKGIKTPSEEILRNCWDNNPDGAGLAVIRNGKAIWRKGLKTFAEVWQVAKKVRRDDLAVYHFRIGTSGGNTNPKMTHPFLLTDQRSEWERLSGKTEEKLIFHNGIFSGMGNEIFSDTCEFVGTILTPLAKQGVDLASPEIKPIIERLVSGSRLAILDPQAEAVSLFGSGWQYDKESGLTFSNGNFRKATYYYDEKFWREWEATQQRTSEARHARKFEAYYPKAKTSEAEAEAKKKQQQAEQRKRKKAKEREICELCKDPAIEDFFWMMLQDGYNEFEALEEYKRGMYDGVFH